MIEQAQRARTSELNADSVCLYVRIGGGSGGGGALGLKTPQNIGSRARVARSI